MALRPFIFTDTIALSANGSGTLLLSVSSGETARFRRMQFIATGAFNITSIRDASGTPFSNASANDPIPNTMLNDGALDVSGIANLNPPLELQGTNSLNIEVTDTSGATNTVRVTIEGEKETG